jgi:hypothetical protein
MVGRQTYGKNTVACSLFNRRRWHIRYYTSLSNRAARFRHAVLRGLRADGMRGSSVMAAGDCDGRDAFMGLWLRVGTPVKTLG